MSRQSARASLWPPAVLLLAACVTPIAPQDVPAAIVDPAPQARAELALTVAKALGVAQVALADDALTASDLLVIEQKPARGAAGERLSGRDFARSEQFRLVKNDARCVLVHQRTGSRYVLKAITCRAVGLSTPSAV